MRIPLLFLALSLLWPVQEAFSARSIRIRKTQTAPIAGKELAAKASAHMPYSDNWSLWGRGDKGHLLYIAVFINRMHPFVGTRGGVQVTVIPPKGKIFHKLQEFKKHHIKASRSKLDVRIGNNRLLSDGKTGYFRVQLRNFRATLSFRSLLPGYRLQGGTLRLGRRRFRGLAFSPRAKLTGTLRWGKRRLRFKGVGYIDKSWQNSPHKIAKVWYNARAWTSQYTILVSNLLPASGWTPRSLPDISIAKGGRWLLHHKSKQARLRIVSSKKDRASGYRVPQKISFRSAGAAGWKLKGSIVHKKMLHRLDVLAHVPKMLRFFIQKLITKPFMYRHRATLKLRLQRNSHVIRLKVPMLTETVFLNP